MEAGPDEEGGRSIQWGWGASEVQRWSPPDDLQVVLHTNDTTTLKQRGGGGGLLL